MKKPFPPASLYGRASSQLVAALAATGIMLMPVLSHAGAFTGRNVVVMSAPNANNTTATMVEVNINTAGQTPTNTIAIDGTTMPGALRVSGSASSSGYLSRSKDESLLTFTGHNVTTTSGNINTQTPRGVGTLNSAGTFALQTTYTGVSGDQTRSATTLNNTSWFIADQAGVHTNGSTSPSPAGNIRSVKTFGSTVYVFQQSATAAAVSTLSDVSGGSITALPGISFRSTGQDFYMISSGENGSTYDVLYIVSNSGATAGTIEKFSLVNGTWSANGSYATNFGGFGLVAADNGNGALLYLTTGTGATASNSVVKVADTTGYNQSITVTTGNNVTLYTASGNILKGIAFTPVQMPDLTASVSAPATATAGTNFDYTITAANNGTANATGVALNFILPSGLSFVSASGASGFSGVNNAGTVNFTGGTLNAGASATLTVTVTTSTAAIYTAAAGAAVIDPATAISEFNETNNSSFAAASTDVSGPALATVTIAATDANAAEAASDTGTFRISRTGSTASALSVSYTISTGAGKAKSTDYSPALSGTVSIPVSSSFVDITITPVDDVLLEGDETLVLNLVDTAAYDLGAGTTATVTIAENDTTVNLATYVRVGRYALPEPTQVSLPPGTPSGNLLCQEASGVTYNWDTDTLFVTCDGGKSITQVSKTGALIDTMTLADGSSPQGTDFYDPEGITYIGGGQFVISEERDRQLVKFTYAAGTTLTRSSTQTVKIGTFVDNTGTEGLSWDPQTGGFICLKEISPMGIFQTGIDFNAGTATNGSPTTENSTNLFNPALAGMTDFGDVFALSNLPALNGQADSSHLILLSQESAKIVNIDRSGSISSTLNITTDVGDTLSSAGMQHEGVTMDREGILYIVNENGGGNINHPQLWVYAPSSVANQAPSALALNNQVNSIQENTSTASSIKVADIVITDDGIGTNVLSLTGTDAASFQITGSALYIKAGVVLDYEIKTSYAVTVQVDDTSVGSTPDASANFTLNVTDVVNETPVNAAIIITEVAPWSSGGNSPVNADWFELTNVSNASVNISGWKVDDDSNASGSAVALNGITTIAPGESVIFIETSNLTTAAATFRSNWFGASPPVGLQIGSYTGSGVGLGTGGDAVNIFDGSNVKQAGITFGASPTSPFKTFDNAACLNGAAVTNLAVAGAYGAFMAVNSPVETGSPGTIGKLIITEVAPWSSGGNSPVNADWFEVTNTGAVAVDITGWKMDDNSESFAGAVALNGITSIAPGESVIFIETNNLATVAATFRSNWFGASPPAGLQIGSYTGSGVGLSTSPSDAVVLYDSVGTRRSKLVFGVSPTGPFQTFDNSALLDNATNNTLSVAGVRGAFVAVNSPVETGSPGTTGRLIVSEVAPWSSGNSPVGADWFELTNTGVVPVNITGWKIDDNSNAFAGASLLSGITNIQPGESVIIIETTTLAATAATFRSNWFGASPPAGLQIGAYSGQGLGTSGDAVNIYDVSGNLKTNVTFGTSPSGPYATFDNAVGLYNAAITTLSVAGTNGAFVAVNSSVETGSPGAIANPPVAPAITTQPQSVSIAYAYTTTLTVAASGSPAPTYQWYVGSSGDTSNPVSGATSATFVTPVLTVTTSYWARATNSAGSANSITATVTVLVSPVYTSANRDVLTPNSDIWSSAGVTLNGTQFINLGLQGVGRVPANTIDSATGENVGSISDMVVTGFTNNGNGSYSGTFNFLPDRGYNSTTVVPNIYSNYAARINQFTFNFTPYTSSTPTAAQNQVAMSFTGSTRFTYDHDNNAGTAAVFTTGLQATGSLTLFGGPAPAAGIPSTQSDGTVSNRLTLDTEGLILDSRPGKTGTGWVGDEYGAYVYHFNASKQIDGYLPLPAALVPHAPVGTTNFATDPPNNGRRINQGMEGIAQSPDGTRLFAMLQSATIQDSGSGNQGRTNTRLLVYDISSSDLPAAPIAQYVIQLPRIDDTGSTSNGSTTTRAGAQSCVVALSNTQMLILARDGNGRGAAGTPVFKSVLLADLGSATNIGTAYDAEGAQVAPSGVLNGSITPIPWTQALNMIGGLGSTTREVAKFGLNTNTAPGDSNSISEKWEAFGLVSCQDSANPSDYFLFIGNDNDFLSGSGKYMDASGTLQSYDGGLENDTMVLVYRVRILSSVQNWRQGYFGTSANSGQAADTADFDGDGVQNIVEYALGINPTIGTGVNGLAALPAASSTETDTLLAGRLTLVFDTNDVTPSDITMTVQATDDLVTWTDVASKAGTGAWTWLGGGTSRIVLSSSGGRTHVKVGDVVPADSAHPHRMMRLRVVTP